MIVKTLAELKAAPPADLYVCRSKKGDSVAATERHHAEHYFIHYGGRPGAECELYVKVVPVKTPLTVWIDEAQDISEADLEVFFATCHACGQKHPASLTCDQFRTLQAKAGVAPVITFDVKRHEPTGDPTRRPPLCPYCGKWHAPEALCREYTEARQKANADIFVDPKRPSTWPKWESNHPNWNHVDRSNCQVCFNERVAVIRDPDGLLRCAECWEDLKPCERCGTVSTRKDGAHYCHKGSNSD